MIRAQEYVEREDEFDINPRPAEENGRVTTAADEDDPEVRDAQRDAILHHLNHPALTRCLCHLTVFSVYGI